MAEYANLITFPSLVESPFVTIRIGDYTFGQVTRKNSGKSIETTFPEFCKSITVRKINGTVNTYTIIGEYAVAPGDDPNKIDKILGKASTSRKIFISYGDWASPMSTYKEEEAIITNVKSNLNMAQFTITYTIEAVSEALSLASNTFSFPAVKDKPSNRIKYVLKNSKYGLSNIFTGMRTDSIINELIASDDAEVEIPAQNYISSLAYISFLVRCMKPINQSPDSIINTGVYSLVIDDTKSSKLEGLSFRVVKVSSSVVDDNSLVTYEVDIGYPENNLITQFQLNNDEAYSILYDYSEEIEQNKYIYKIDNKGNMTTEYSPSIARSRTLNKIVPENTTWWTAMTQFPVSAVLTLKGLLRPAMLMQYVKVNTYFYGRKHISSGIYIITQQLDTINDGGYRTQLSLTRVKPDDTLQ